MTFKAKFTSTTELSKAIESIARRGAKLDSDIQDAALSCLARVQDHGDVGFLNRLYFSLSKGTRTAALAEWAAKYGKVKINMDKATNKELPFVFWKEGNTDYEGAVNEPWYKCKPNKPLDEEFDFVGKLEALIKHAQKQHAAGKPVKGLERLHAITGEKPVVAVQMAVPAEELAA